MSKFDPVIHKLTNFTQTFVADESSLQEAKTCFFDSLACAFLALEHDKVQNFCSLAYIKDSSGSVGVIGTDTKTNVVDANIFKWSINKMVGF